jgi:hypothetical protein
MKMKTLSNIASAGGFVKIAFLQVDVSCWLQNICRPAL